MLLDPKKSHPNKTSFTRPPPASQHHPKAGSRRPIIASTSNPPNTPELTEAQKIAAQIAKKSPGRRAMQIASKILVVEDNPETRKHLEASLREIYGKENVFVAADLTDAYHYLGKEKIDVVVLDLHLKNGLSGLHLLNSLKEQHHKTGLVIHTASAMEGTVSKAFTTLDQIRSENVLALAESEAAKAQLAGNIPVGSAPKIDGFENLINLIDTMLLLKEGTTVENLQSTYERLANSSVSVSVSDQMVHVFCENLRNYSRFLTESVADISHPQPANKKYIDTLDAINALAKKYSKIDFKEVKRKSDQGTYQVIHDIINDLVNKYYDFELVFKVAPEFSKLVDTWLRKLNNYGKDFKLESRGEVCLFQYLSSLALPNSGLSIYRTKTYSGRISDPDSILREALKDIVSGLPKPVGAYLNQITLTRLSELETARALSGSEDSLSKNNFGSSICITIELNNPQDNFDNVATFIQGLKEMGVGYARMVPDRPNAMNLYIKAGERELLKPESMRKRAQALDKVYANEDYFEELDNKFVTEELDDRFVIIGASPISILCGEGSSGRCNGMIYSDRDTKKTYFAQGAGHIDAAGIIANYYEHTEPHPEKNDCFGLINVTSFGYRVDIYSGNRIVIDLEPDDASCEAVKEFFTAYGLPEEYLHFYHFDRQGKRKW